MATVFDGFIIGLRSQVYNGCAGYKVSSHEVYDDIYGIASFGSHFGSALKSGARISDTSTGKCSALAVIQFIITFLWKTVTHLHLVLTYSTLGNQFGLEGTLKVRYRSDRLSWLATSQSMGRDRYH
ncbi:unnamed protein product [Sphagnum jensenii]|uniref:Uncharacterized protein n=1 Tax=Sphagnum jensenii TaxID=128206 RepID=A0ABP0VES3_9BRYO